MSFAHLFSPAARAFLRENANADPTALALLAARFPGLPLRDLVAQVAARQRVAAKLPTWVAQESVVWPPTLSLEQSSSEATARFKAGLATGGTLADLTGGLGVDAWAFSQAVETVFYVEQNEELAALAAHNLPALGCNNVRIFAQSAGRFLEENGPFDCMYLDPHRRSQASQKVFRLQDCEPNVLEIKELLLKKAPLVLLKAAPLLDLDEGIRQLHPVARVWVLAVANEVKEVLFALDTGATGDPEIRAVNLPRHGPAQEVAFTRAEERQAAVSYSAPLHYLYEPHAALLKAGAFRVLCPRYGLAKLHVSSHLYTSAALVKDFPGRIFRVKTVCKPDRRALHEALPEGRANLTLRNFPGSVAQLRQQLGLAEGGFDYVFATTGPDGRHLLVLTEKVPIGE